MTTLTRPAYRIGSALPLSAAIVAVAASTTNALIAFAAVGLGAQVIGGLQPAAFLTFTVIAAVAGAVGWHLINRLAHRPARVMRWLVPTFLVVSLLPDVAVGMAMGWLIAGPLMLMHVATITIAVLTYRRLMPLRILEPERRVAA